MISAAKMSFAAVVMVLTATPIILAPAANVAAAAVTSTAEAIIGLTADRIDRSALGENAVCTAGSITFFTVGFTTLSISVSAHLLKSHFSTLSTSFVNPFSRLPPKPRELALALTPLPFKIRISSSRIGSLR